MSKAFTSEETPDDEDDSDIADEVPAELAAIPAIKPDEVLVRVPGHATVKSGDAVRIAWDRATRRPCLSSLPPRVPRGGLESTIMRSVP